MGPDVTPCSSDGRMTYRVKKEKGGYRVFAAEDHKALKQDSPKHAATLHTVSQDSPKHAAVLSSFSQDSPKHAAVLSSVAQDSPKHTAALDVAAQDSPKHAAVVSSVSQDSPKHTTTLHIASHDSTKHASRLHTDSPQNTEALRPKHAAAVRSVTHDGIRHTSLVNEDGAHSKSKRSVSASCVREAVKAAGPERPVCARRGGSDKKPVGQQHSPPGGTDVDSPERRLSPSPAGHGAKAGSAQDSVYVNSCGDGGEVDGGNHSVPALPAVRLVGDGSQVDGVQEAAEEDAGQSGTVHTAAVQSRTTEDKDESCSVVSSLPEDKDKCSVAPSPPGDADKSCSVVLVCRAEDKDTSCNVVRPSPDGKDTSCKVVPPSPEVKDTTCNVVPPSPEKQDESCIVVPVPVSPHRSEVSVTPCGSASLGPVTSPCPEEARSWHSATSLCSGREVEAVTARSSQLSLTASLLTASSRQSSPGHAYYSARSVCSSPDGERERGMRLGVGQSVSSKSLSTASPAKQASTLTVPTPRGLYRSVKSLCSTPIKTRAAKERRHSSHGTPSLRPDKRSDGRSPQGTPSPGGGEGRVEGPRLWARLLAVARKKKSGRSPSECSRPARPRPFLSPHRAASPGLLRHQRGPRSASDRNLQVREDRPRPRCQSSPRRPSRHYASPQHPSPRHPLYATVRASGYWRSEDGLSLRVYSTPEKERFLQAHHRQDVSDHHVLAWPQRRPSYMDYGWIYPNNPRRALNYEMYDQRCWVCSVDAHVPCLVL